MLDLLWVSFVCNSVAAGCFLCEDIIKQVKYYNFSDWESLSCIKQWWYMIPVKWKWQNRHFWQIFFDEKYLCVKIVAKTDKKIWWGILIENLNWKRTNCFHWSGGSLWLFKLCDKMQLSFCVASITIPTSFHQCLSVKPCFEMKFCRKFLDKIYFSVVWKVVA